MEKKPEYIYHLVVKSELKNQIKNNQYIPLRFENDKFIHCAASEDISLLVANNYFSKTKDVLILKLKLSKIQAKIIFESAASFADEGNSLLKEEILFPHIYGSLNLDSIEKIGILEKENENYKMPKNFYEWAEFLQKEEQWN